MDNENRLQKMEAQVHRARTRMWIVLLGVLALCLQLLPTPSYLHAILIIFVLIAMIYLIVSVVSDLRELWTSRAAAALHLDKILREVIAERAQARDQDRNP